MSLRPVDNDTVFSCKITGRTVLFGWFVSVWIGDLGERLRDNYILSADTMWPRWKSATCCSAIHAQPVGNSSMLPVGKLSKKTSQNLLISALYRMKHSDGKAASGPMYGIFDSH